MTDKTVTTKDEQQFYDLLEKVIDQIEDDVLREELNEAKGRLWKVLYYGQN